MLRQTNRRAFVAGLGSAAVWPLTSRAQHIGRTYRIGILAPVPAAQDATNLNSLRKRLTDFGYIEGRNLFIEYRSADGKAERFSDLASELVALNLDLILTRGTPATTAVQKATGTIPIVMMTMGGPGAIVTSFARPMGNVTGLITFSTELTAKRVEILKELVPTLSRVGLVHNMGNPAVPIEWEETNSAADKLGLQAQLLDVRSEDDLRLAFDRAITERINGLIVGADGLTQMYRQLIVEGVARHEMPTIFPDRDFVVTGGLISYAVRYTDLYFQLADLIDKIFRGKKPSDLPVQQPTKFELVINLKTSKALGLTIPPKMFARADEVIE